ncbi:MAG: hypothetical protein ABJL99_18890 [Aliishimia sp.]
MTLNDILRALGLRADDPVQPDVSGHTILNLLVQGHGQPDVMLPAFGSLYERVDVLEQTDASTADVQRVAADLWRADQRYATVQCTTAQGEHASGVASQAEQGALWDMARAPLQGSATQRVLCSFTYWDREPEASAFLQQASVWTDAEIGALEQEIGIDGGPQWTAISTAPVRAVTLARPARGDESTATVVLVMDLP